MVHPQKFDGQYIGGYWAGYRFKEALGYTSGVHTGVDYNYSSGNVDLGYATHAVCYGKVVAKIANGTVSGFGNGVIIESSCPPGIAGSKMYHRYLHMNSVNVNVGQTVTEGQQIGTVGNTGTTYAHTHLDIWTDRGGLGPHWEYHKDTALSSYEDPYKLIEAFKGWNGEPTMGLTRQNIIDEYQVNRGADPAESEIAAHMNGGTWQSMSLGFRKENDVRRAYYASLEAEKIRLENANKELTATVARQQATINDQQALINGQKVEIAELSDENAKLKEQLAVCGNSEDTTNLNKLGEVLRWLLVRLGLKG